MFYAHRVLIVSKVAFLLSYQISWNDDGDPSPSKCQMLLDVVLISSQSQYKYIIFQRKWKQYVLPKILPTSFISFISYNFLMAEQPTSTYEVLVYLDTWQKVTQTESGAA